MLIFTPFSNFIFTFVAVMIAGHDLASAHPHPLSGHRTDFPHRNSSITDSPLLRRNTCTGTWAGAVWENTPAGVAWTGISAYLLAPKAVSMKVSGFVWVGIDGTVCNNKPSFQVGIQAYPANDGSTQYYAVAQWGQQQSYQFDNFPIDAGDILVIAATASAASGTATVQNISKQLKASYTFNRPEPFLFATAEWVVQTFAQGGSSSVFGQVDFYNAQATQNDGTTVNGAGADMYDAGGAASVSADVYGAITVAF
ncbi:Peptidase A4 family domain containing protein [Amanita muscaria]